MYVIEMLFLIQCPHTTTTTSSSFNTTTTTTTATNCPQSRCTGWSTRSVTPFTRVARTALVSHVCVRVGKSRLAVIRLLLHDPVQSYVATTGEKSHAGPPQCDADLLPSARRNHDVETQKPKLESFNLCTLAAALVSSVPLQNNTIEQRMQTRFVRV
jgi:hypothetical protein